MTSIPGTTSNKRMLTDWFYATLQTSRKYGRYIFQLFSETIKINYE